MGDDDAADTALGIELSTDGPRARFYTVLADRLEFDDDQATFLRAGDVVFQCPRASLVSVSLARRAAPPQTAAPLAAHAAGIGQPTPRHTARSANTRWTAGDEKHLRELYEAGEPIEAIARALGRERGAIRSRVTRLRLATRAQPDGEPQS